MDDAIDGVSQVATDRGTAARGRGCTLLVTSAEGVPSRSVMSSSWCTTLRPGNRGFPSSTSAKMQPMDQMSMAGLYFAKKLPHSSGARYLPAPPSPPSSLPRPVPSRPHTLHMCRGATCHTPCTISNHRTCRPGRDIRGVRPPPAGGDIVCPEYGGGHVVEGGPGQSEIAHLHPAPFGMLASQCSACMRSQIL